MKGKIRWWGPDQIVVGECDPSRGTQQLFSFAEGKFARASSLEGIVSEYQRRNKKRLGDDPLCLDWAAGSQATGYWVSYVSLSVDGEVRMPAVEYFRGERRVKAQPTQDSRFHPISTQDGRVISVLAGGLRREPADAPLGHYHLDVFKGKKRLPSFYRPHFDVACADKVSGSRVVDVRSIAVLDNGELWVGGRDCHSEGPEPIVERFKKRGGWGKVVTVPEKPHGEGRLLAVGDQIWFWTVPTGRRTGYDRVLARHDGKRWHEEVSPTGDDPFAQLVHTSDGTMWLSTEGGGLWSKASAAGTDGSTEWQLHPAPSGLTQLRTRTTPAGEELWLIAETEAWLRQTPR